MFTIIFHVHEFIVEQEYFIQKWPFSSTLWSARVPHTYSSSARGFRWGWRSVLCIINIAIFPNWEFHPQVRKFHCIFFTSCEPRTSKISCAWYFFLLFCASRRRAISSGKTFYFSDILSRISQQRFEFGTKLSHKPVWKISQLHLQLYLKCIQVFFAGCNQSGTQVYILSWLFILRNARNHHCFIDYQ